MITYILADPYRQTQTRSQHESEAQIINFPRDKAKPAWGWLLSLPLKPTIFAFLLLIIKNIQSEARVLGAMTPMISCDGEKFSIHPPREPVLKSTIQIIRRKHLSRGIANPKAFMQGCPWQKHPWQQKPFESDAHNKGLLINYNISRKWAVKPLQTATIKDYLMALEGGFSGCDTYLENETEWVSEMQPCLKIRGDKSTWT